MPEEGLLLSFVSLDKYSLHLIYIYIYIFFFFCLFVWVLQWGFRRCEDICWVKTNKSSAAPTLRHDSRTVFQRSKVCYGLPLHFCLIQLLLIIIFSLFVKEHCLMGIKGTVRRSTDGHIIHANIDTDVIIAEEPPYG